MAADNEPMESCMPIAMLLGRLRATKNATPTICGTRVAMPAMAWPAMANQGSARDVRSRGEIQV